MLVRVVIPSFITNALVRLGSSDLQLPLPVGARLSRIPKVGGGRQGGFNTIVRGFEFISISAFSCFW